MKKIILAALLPVCVTLAYAGGTVHLKGKFEGMSSPVKMEYNGASSALGESRTVEIPTDAAGNFDITVPLDAPGYYTIARSILWLTPGDDLEIVLSPDQTAAVFKGRGAEANEYLKGRLFPRGGSYLASGRNVRADFAATRKTVDSLAHVTVARIYALENVTDEFREQEIARMQADLVNSYLNYPNYVKEWRELPKDSVAARMEAFARQVQPRVTGLIKRFTDERFLDVGMVRDIMVMSLRPGYEMFYEGVELPARTRELAAAYVEARKLSKPDAQAVAEVRKFASTMTQPDFKRELELRCDGIKLLDKGTPAIDLALESPDGIVSRLSDLKGKVLCIDLWATWCGPCMKEAPYFAALAEKMKGLPVAFVQISTDTNKAAWQNFLKTKGHGTALQFLSHDRGIDTGWQVTGIPRFILIDKDFRIIAADAPRPSGPELEALIRANLP